MSPSNPAITRPLAPAEDVLWPKSARNLRAACALSALLCALLEAASAGTRGYHALLAGGTGLHAPAPIAGLLLGQLLALSITYAYLVSIFHNSVFSEDLARLTRKDFLLPIVVSLAFLVDLPFTTITVPDQARYWCLAVLYLYLARLGFERASQAKADLALEAGNPFLKSISQHRRSRLRGLARLDAAGAGLMLVLPFFPAAFRYPGAAIFARTLEGKHLILLLSLVVYSLVHLARRREARLANLPELYRRLISSLAPSHTQRLDWSNLRKIRYVIDVGCGPGIRLVEVLRKSGLAFAPDSELEVLLIDKSRATVENASEHLCACGLAEAHVKFEDADRPSGIETVLSEFCQRVRGDQVLVLASHVLYFSKGRRMVEAVLAHCQPGTLVYVRGCGLLSIFTLLWQCFSRRWWRSTTNHLWRDKPLSELVKRCGLRRVIQACGRTIASNQPDDIYGLLVPWKNATEQLYLVEFIELVNDRDVSSAVEGYVERIARARIDSRQLDGFLHDEDVAFWYVKGDAPGVCAPCGWPANGVRYRFEEPPPHVAPGNLSPATATGPAPASHPSG
jgi:hypothetical protein